LLQETEELIKIFVSSIKTTELKKINKNNVTYAKEHR
jgi:hypothetical protein